MNLNGHEAVKKLLYPEAVAVVGASNDKGKTGGRLFSYMAKSEFTGRLYPVNPKSPSVQGVPAFESLRTVPEDIDLAFLVLPAHRLIPVLEDCREKNVKTVVVNTSGFSEIGEEGKRLQEELVSRAHQYGIRICGPNTIGVVNTYENFFGSFSMAMDQTTRPRGRIAFVTQSGAIGGGMLSRIWDEGIGISHFISSGNEGDLDSADYLTFLLEDEHTDVICMYVEGVTDGPKFMKALARVREAGKPVVIYKNGRTDVGKKSVRSHTGSLAGNHQVFEALFEQYGLISVSKLEDLFDVAKAIAVTEPPAGRKVGIVSSSGGACTILADSCIEHGLEVPPFEKKSEEKLREVVPDYGTPQNPFDTTANIINDPDSFRKAMQILQEDEQIDAIILMLTTVGEPIASRVARDIIGLSHDGSKPFLVSWTISPSLASNGFALLKEANIPIYPTPERTVEVLSKMISFHERKSKERMKEHERSFI